MALADKLAKSRYSDWQIKLRMAFIEDRLANIEKAEGPLTREREVAIIRSTYTPEELEAERKFELEASLFDPLADEQEKFDLLGG